MKVIGYKLATKFLSVQVISEITIPKKTKHASSQNALYACL